MTEVPEEARLAALDLGSNSFHLLISNQTNGETHVVERIKEMVRLAEGLDGLPVTRRALSGRPTI